MKKNNLYIFITAYLALLIITPGRFVYGIIVMLELFLLVMTGTLTLSLIKKIKMEEITSLILMTVLISFTILYRQILVITFTEIALTLTYVLYFPTLSVFLLNNLILHQDKTLRVRIVKNLRSSITFTVLGLLFFLFRDIAGYGTITFFGKNHNIYEKLIFKSDGSGVFAFVASIPGALILSGISIFIFQYITRKIKIVKNVEQQQ